MSATIECPPSSTSASSLESMENLPISTLQQNPHLPVDTASTCTFSDFPPRNTLDQFSGPLDGKHVAITLDPQLWGTLPNHILEYVLAFLPFWSVLQLQTVSKKWKQYLTSPNFLARWENKSPAYILFIMFTDYWKLKAVAAYNPCLNTWHIIPLLHFSLTEASRGFQILASAGGLICTEEIAWPERTLIVYNPMNKSYRKLPSMLDMSSPYVVGMIVEADRTGYRIVVAQDGESLISQYYDSKSDSWKMNVALNRKVAMLAGMTSLEGFLFCLSFWPLGLIAYDVEKALWKDMQIRMPASMSSPHVVQYNSKLFLVGGQEEYGQLASIGIWKLDLASKECTQVEQMPDYLFQSFVRILNGDQFTCTGDAGLICFSNGSTSRILMYSMRSGIWWWLPPCPLHEHSPKTHRKNSSSPLGFPIKPCFEMRA